MTISTSLLPDARSEEVLLPLFYPYALTRFLEAHGIDRREILCGTGITPSELSSLDTRISHARHSRLLSNAHAAWDKPGLGLAFGSSLKLHSLGMIGQAARASRTLGEAMDTITRYLALRSPLLSYNRYREADGALVYMLKGSRDLGTSERFMMEAGLAATRAFLTELSGKKLAMVTFNFKREPHGSFEMYQQVLGKHVRFEQESDNFHIPATVASLELTTRNQMTAEEARRYCEAEIAQLGVEAGFKQVVYDLLVSKLRTSLKETDAATMLGCSPRSLRRRLAEQGTTFRDLHQLARFDTAKRLLTTTQRSVEEIAHEIGYLNVGNFSRAFKTWSGHSPSVYRRMP